MTWITIQKNWCKTLLGTAYPKEQEVFLVKGENMQQIHKRPPIPKCNFNKVALQLYWNHTLA